jgi:hypothetical protein
MEIKYQQEYAKAPPTASANGSSQTVGKNQTLLAKAQSSQKQAKNSSSVLVSFGKKIESADYILSQRHHHASLQLREPLRLCEKPPIRSHLRSKSSADLLLKVGGPSFGPACQEFEPSSTCKLWRLDASTARTERLRLPRLSVGLQQNDGCQWPRPGSNRPSRATGMAEVAVPQPKDGITRMKNPDV